MIVGFTGTRMGMKSAQALAVSHLCSSWLIHDAHHGLCRGADDEFHWIIRDLAIGPSVVIHGHPPIDRRNVARVHTWANCNVMYPDKLFGVRDKDIVMAADRMIATPYCPEIVRSGTWMTIRMARKQSKPLWIVMPDGEIIEERTR